MIYCIQVITMLKKEILEQDKETMELEYELICNFVKLRHDLGLTQQQMADEAGVIRELIAILESCRELIRE